ncbi:uncharacterized protein LOC126735978 isoform X2 [Anthonomus grandis grandis]|uniref:uncharacterized protein LOC126735978 isoform X2 n=1 Tax=Anthonomus grandis grandis TaxID=2921223 RepID=UPI002165CEDB|nr:uncharacterized protein LOC126735978 isoform X2 [Anthonomus grandis grandis]
MTYHVLISLKMTNILTIRFLIYVLLLRTFIQADESNEDSSNSSEEEKKKNGTNTFSPFILKPPMLVQKNGLYLNWSKNKEVTHCTKIFITYFYDNLACPKGTRALSRTETIDCQFSSAYIKVEDNWKFLNISLKINGNNEFQPLFFPNFTENTTTLRAVWKPVINLTGIYERGKIRLRWKLPENLDCLPDEYRIYHDKGYSMAKNIMTNSKDEQTMILNVNGPKRNVSIKVITCNYYIKNKMQDIEEVKENPKYYAVVKVPINLEKPDPPFNITYKWSNELDFTYLNIWWEYEYRTKKIKEFKIRLELNENEISSKTVSPSGAIQYYESFKIETKIIKLHLYISALSKDGETSIESTTDSSISPANPKPYPSNKIKITGENLLVPEPVIEYFESRFVIFKSEWYNSEKFQIGLDKEIDLVKHGIITNGMLPRHNQYLNELKLSNSSKEQSLIFNRKQTMNDGKKYVLVVFITNSLNMLRVINVYKKEVYNICPPKITDTIEDPQDCSQYLLCSDGNAVEKKCPEEKIFNNESKQCDLKLDRYNKCQKPKKETNDTWISITSIIILVGAISTGVIVFYMFRSGKNYIGRRRKISENIYLIYTPNVSQSCNIDDYTLDEYERFDDRVVSHSKRIKINCLKEYVKEAIEGPELLRQHQLFPKIDPKCSAIIGNLPSNIPKNRYNNITAYDDTRVKLIKLNEDDGSDYINANFISGYNLPEAYIAAQGPKSNTVIDFWRMIWERNVNCIIMLTNLYDGKKKCCEKYFPDKGEFIDFGGISVEFCKETSTMTYIVREFNIFDESFCKKITHIHFTAWPSQGQPLFAETMVPLLQYMLTIPYSSKHPILVHCSAGVGRTGTVILCDMCLRMCAAEGAVDVLAFFAKMRTERPNMVDNVEQYKLAHLAILACLTARDTGIECGIDLFENKVLNILFDDQMQYIKDNEWQDDAMKSVASVVQHIPIVPEKNRYKDILPDEVFQVFLSRLPNGGPSSCYINAIYVNSFMCPKRYVVTQHPLTNTINDFWRLVIEQQIKNIINIDPVLQNEQRYDGYF